MKQLVDQEKKDNSTELFVKCLDNEKKRDNSNGDD